MEEQVSVSTLPNFAKFHPQTTAIYSLSKLSAFRQKYSNFNTMMSLSLASVEILDFSLACEKGLSWAIFVPHFCCDTTLIACNTCISHVYFWYFSTNRQRFQHNDVIIYDVTATINL